MWLVLVVAVTSVISVCSGCACGIPFYTPPQLHIGDMKTWIEKLVKHIPDKDSGAYTPPDSFEINSFRSAVEAFVSEQWEPADTKANEVNYKLMQLVDSNNNSNTYALLPEDDNHDGRGYFLLRTSGHWEMNVVIESPHSRFDGTGSCVAEVFSESGAKGFVMAGTHRCSNTAPTDCSGTTSVCDGTSQRYRESDMAHVQDTFFQVYHEVLVMDSPSLTAVQIHGMRSNDDDPEFVASVGIQQNITNAISNNLAEILYAKIEAAGSTKSGRSCNRVETGWKKRLCATTNTQGRFSNGRRDGTACTIKATENSNKFIHLENSYNLLNTESDDDKVGPYLITETLKELFL